MLLQSLVLPNDANMAYMTRGLGFLFVPPNRSEWSVAQTRK